MQLPMLRRGGVIGWMLILWMDSLFSPMASATALIFSFADPVNDHTGAIDVTHMDLTFDDATGDYEINLSADPAHPFVGTFDVTINVFNPNTGTTQPAPSFFRDVRVGIEATSPTTTLTLLGTNPRLMAWRVGDHVATSNVPFGAPAGFDFFRSFVMDPGAGFGDGEDTVAAVLNDFGVIAGDAAVIRAAPPAVVARFPAIGQVINRVDGVTEIVVQYERPATLTQVAVSGVRAGPVTGGFLEGNGTSRHRLVLAAPLTDRDRYTVTMTVDSNLVQWDFITLVGDCDGNGVVDIFDFFRVRRALKAGTFDESCDFVEDGVINIFDLLSGRQALRVGARAP